MAKPTAASLKERVAFDQRADVDDGFGNTQGGWVEQFTCAAEFRHQGGTEAAQAARLQGRNVFGVYVRSTVATRSVDSTWQLRDTRRDTDYAIRMVDALSDRAWVYMMVESGVAA
jgi:hypothetical protein